MKIRFKPTDPRAGLVVDLESHRALHLISTGAAEAFDAAAQEPEDPSDPKKPDPKKKPPKKPAAKKDKPPE